MRKKVKSTFIFAFAMAIFSIFALAGGISFNMQGKASAVVATTYEISDAGNFYNRISGYADQGAISKWVLTKDIDMKDYVLHSTIGTSSNPFRGTFDGQGHTISNLNLDFSTTLQGDPQSSPEKYIGLFGNTSGATISNVQLAGTTNITIGDTTTAYVGSLIGFASNTTVRHIQNVSSIKLDGQTFDHSLNFGGLIGCADSCNISYIINRQNDIIPMNFEDNKSRIHSIGGVVGTMLNSSLAFGVSKSYFNVTVGENFAGEIKLGGVFGTASGNGVVKEINITAANMLVENAIYLTNYQSNDLVGKVYAGQVGGAISSPYPPALALSSIYYKKNANAIAAFGQTNGHNFENATTFDNILEDNRQFVNDSMINASNMRWHPKLGSWDFERVWYFNASIIYLQSFYGGFNVGVSQDATSLRVFDIVPPKTDKYLYESSAEIVFSFKENDEGISLSNFYTITGLKKGGVEKVKIENIGGQYRVVSSADNDSALDDYSISESNGTFTITIKNINRLTAGTNYDIACEPKPFFITATSRLYDSNGDYQDTEPPAYIYVGDTSMRLPYVFQTAYNTSRTLEARLRNNSLPYALEGWYMEVEDGDDILLGSNNSYEVNFGSGNFTGNRTIYAKYRDDACKISFDVKGEGISEIYLRETLVKDNVATVSKTLSSLKLDIYVKEGYEFDVKRFLDMISTYRGEDTTNPFCTWTNESSGDKNHYVFNLDMTTLKGEFSEEFSVNIDTVKTSGGSKTWIWYVVGGVGGAVLLGVVIFLIVFFAKRRGSGGGKLGGGYSKKSFKGGYY